MSDGELLYKSSLDLAAMVRSGELSARELTEIALARIDDLNPQLNAFIMTDAERALATADEIKPGDERPFAGVPTAIKDIGAMLEATRSPAAPGFSATSRRRSIRRPFAASKTPGS